MMCVCVDRVAVHEADNLMGVTNLSTIFAAVLISSDAVSCSLSSQTKHNSNTVFT